MSVSSTWNKYSWLCHYLIRKRSSSLSSASNSEKESRNITEDMDTSEKSSTLKKTKQQLTVEKWQQNYEHVYQCLGWLQCTAVKEGATMVQSLFCEI